MYSESELIDEAVEVLRRRLPPMWSIDTQTVRGTDDSDILITTPQRVSSVLYVEARNRVTPRDVEALIGRQLRKWRGRVGSPIVLVAPYIGPRVRQLLIEENVSYIDLTGNVRLSVDNLNLFVQLDGAAQDPEKRSVRAGLRGGKSGTVVRVLADATPPYSGAEIARVAQVDPGYLSRILESLESEGFLERERSGTINVVDWPGLLTRRAENVDLFRRGAAYRFISREGATSVLDQLRQTPSGANRVTVTGSFAAARWVTAAAPTLLVLYAPRAIELGDSLSLIRSDVGADVIVMQPDGETPLRGATIEDGISWAAPSQVAIDCLAGTGRMPQEGAALIEWMKTSEPLWRAESIDDLERAWARAPSGQ